MKNDGVQHIKLIDLRFLAKKIILISGLFLVMQVEAVNVNPKGTGEVFLQPYYTVNNNLNTLVSVTNPTTQAKAIKINIREGLNGYSVLSYNVYLSPFDVWTFGLVSGVSTMDDFFGQESAIHFSSDTSCAPFLVKAGHEFLPFELADGLQNMSRVREGFIEVIDMGGISGNFASAVDQGTVGVPANCAALQSAWESGGVWHEESGGDVNENLLSVTGGLVVEANIVDVVEGLNFSIPVVALANFFAEDQIAHVPPSDSSLSLDAAAPKATVFANEKAYQLAFESGIDAVSAVLMADQLIANYALDTFIAGKSETVLTQPSRRFYVTEQGGNNLPPYGSNDNNISCNSEVYGGTEVSHLIWDRESQFANLNNIGADPLPVDLPKSAVCGSVFIQNYLTSTANQVFEPQITQSENYYSISTAYDGTENGFAVTSFTNTQPLLAVNMSNEESVQLMGLPIIGVTLQKFTNAGAAQGLLAQYGSAHQMKSVLKLIVEGGVNR